MTRGKTHQGRLSGLDAVLLYLGQEALSSASGPLLVDVGFGAQAVTTYELWRSVRARHPDAQILGLEVDAQRVAVARERYGGLDGLSFEVGGFDAPLEGASVVRAMNVLRQYSAAQVAPAHEAWGRWLRPGGVLIEGTADAQGDRLCAHWMRRPLQDVPQGELERHALLFLIGQPPQFAPMMWRDYLPRDWRRSMTPQTALARFFARWMDAWEQVRATVHEPRACFIESAQALSMTCADELWWDEGLGALGALGWRPRGGVPVAPLRA